MSRRSCFSGRLQIHRLGVHGVRQMSARLGRPWRPHSCRKSPEFKSSAKEVGAQAIFQSGVEVVGISILSSDGHEEVHLNPAGAEELQLRGGC